MHGECPRYQASAAPWLLEAYLTRIAGGRRCLGPPTGLELHRRGGELGEQRRTSPNTTGTSSTPTTSSSPVLQTLPGDPPGVDSDVLVPGQLFNLATAASMLGDENEVLAILGTVVGAPWVSTTVVTFIGGAGPRRSSCRRGAADDQRAGVLHSGLISSALAAEMRAAGIGTGRWDLDAAAAVPLGTADRSRFLLARRCSRRATSCRRW